MANLAQFELAPDVVEREPTWIGEQYIVLTVAGTDIAVPLGMVLEVERVPPLVPVPGGPAWVVGIANLRGTILTVADLAAMLNLGTWIQRADARVIVVRSIEPLALGVDAVRGMRRLSPGSLLNLEGALPEQLTRFVTGIHRDGS
ncbi:MAG TPA: chemotaxis protein CheW, partial [Thermomicrobiales bacterium]|nr:chemotaxis protein CheW [Thermomicrobiales bacterium]